MTDLRICDIVAFAPILAPHQITADKLSLEQFMHYAKMWRRRYNTPIFEHYVDDRTKELAVMVDDITEHDAPLTLTEIMALLPLLYEQRDVNPLSWKLFCDNMKNPSISFRSGLYYCNTWAEQAVPLTLNVPTPALSRLFAELVPHPLLEKLYLECTGEKGVKTRWISLLSFHREFRDLFAQWRYAEILENGVRLDPAHADVFLFGVGWTADLTEYLKKIKNKNG